MIWNWLFGGEVVEVTCDVDIERTRDSLHAHAIPDGIDIRPGDRVTLRETPPDVGFGEARTARVVAVVVRAGLLTRIWTRFTGLFQLTELYEVGFQPKEHA